ncbi:hypothetical protein BDZ45DRAFT_735992 [Acephala macrosclerotiorum]|nr:hypothetical protein BDZ45DRAFT_735992 [Acephala macrosclerotiorum]
MKYTLVLALFAIGQGALALSHAARPHRGGLYLAEEELTPTATCQKKKQYCGYIALDNGYTPEDLEEAQAAYGMYLSDPENAIFKCVDGINLMPVQQCGAKGCTHVPLIGGLTGDYCSVITHRTSLLKPSAMSPTVEQSYHSGSVPFKDSIKSLEFEKEWERYLKEKEEVERRERESEQACYVTRDQGLSNIMASENSTTTGTASSHRVRALDPPVRRRKPNLSEERRREQTQAVQETNMLAEHFLISMQLGTNSNAGVVAATQAYWDC